MAAALMAMIPTLSLSLLFVLVAVASFLPEHRLWGINHLAYYPVPIRVGALFIMAVTFIPMVSRSVYAALAKLHGLLHEHRRAAILVSLAVALVAFFVFGAFQSSTLLLGDGEVVANELNATYRGDSTMVLKAVTLINRAEPIARGTTTMYFLSSVVQSRLFGMSPVDSVRWFNGLLGSVFVFVMLIVAARMASATLAIWMVLVVITSGAMQLFFGYVENYTPLFLIGMLYMIASFRAVRGNGRVWVPIVLFVMAVYSHVSGILLGPSLIFVIGSRFAGPRLSRALPLFLVIVTLATTFVTALFTPLSKYFLPLWPTQSVYSVLSWNHWVDIFNELLLLLPLLPLLVVGGVSLWRGRNGEWRLALLVFVPTLLYMILFNPEIGMARDWDLFTPILFGLVPLAVFGIERLINKGWAKAHATAIPILVIGGALVIAWIGVNASPHRSTDRFEDILAYQENRPDYAYEVLAKTYREQGRLTDAIRVQETVTSISPNPRHHLTLARYYREYGDTDAAFQILQRTTSAHPSYSPSRRELLAALSSRGRFEEVIATARVGMTYHPEDPFYHFYVGRSLIRTGRLDEGRAELLEAQRLRPGPQLGGAIANELNQANNRN